MFIFILIYFYDAFLSVIFSLKSRNFDKTVFSTIQTCFYLLSARLLLCEFTSAMTIERFRNRKSQAQNTDFKVLFILHISIQVSINGARRLNMKVWLYCVLVLKDN